MEMLRDAMEILHDRCGCARIVSIQGRVFPQNRHRTIGAAAYDQSSGRVFVLWYDRKVAEIVGMTLNSHLALRDVEMMVVDILESKRYKLVLEVLRDATRPCHGPLIDFLPAEARQAVHKLVSGGGITSAKWKPLAESGNLRAAVIVLILFTAI